MILNLYQKVDILFGILEELLSSPFNKQFDDKAKHALSKHGLEVIDGKIVKSHRKVSAEAKENGYGESKDEKIKKALISILKSDFEKDTTIYDISVGDIIDWLEKQGQRSQSHWKPSDEQLYILNWLATNVLGDGVVDKKASEILYTLYDDLKKLKGD